MHRSAHPSLSTLLTILAMTVLAAPSGSARTVQIAGTDLLDPWLPAWFNKGIVGDRSHEFAFELHGSHGGWIALQQGYADACVYLQSEGAPPLPDGFESTVIAYCVLYLYAPSDFPDSQVSMESLAAIASPDESTSALTWHQLLKNPATWQEASTLILVDSGPHRITESLFRLKVGQRNGQHHERVRYLAPGASLIDTIRVNRHFVLVSNRPMPPETRLRAIPVKGFGESVAFPATLDTIEFSDYPLVFPILLLHPRERKWVSDFLSILRQPSLQQAFEANHLVFPQEQ